MFEDFGRGFGLWRPFGRSMLDVPASAGKACASKLFAVAMCCSTVALASPRTMPSVAIKKRRERVWTRFSEEQPSRCEELFNSASGTLQ